MLGLPSLALVLHNLTVSPKRAERFIWLFSYDYVNLKLGRIWPENLDFRPGLLVCGALFVIGAVALWFAKRHRVLVLLPLGAAIAFTVYLLGVYLPETSKHWSQKPLISKYYELRASPEEPLVAWQMFWHGETFYTSNDIYDGPKAERTVFLGKTNRADLKAFFGKQRGKNLYGDGEAAHGAPQAPGPGLCQEPHEHRMGGPQQVLPVVDSALSRHDPRLTRLTPGHPGDNIRAL